jgi:hypothetical protein
MKMLSQSNGFSWPKPFRLGQQIARFTAVGCARRATGAEAAPAASTLLDERGAEVVERIVQVQRELRYGDYVLRLGGL